MIDLHQSGIRIHSSDCYFLPPQQGRETDPLGLLEQVRHGKLGRGSVVVDKIPEQPWREGGVGDGGVFNGEDGGVLSGEEVFRGDLKERGNGVESGSSQSS